MKKQLSLLVLFLGLCGLLSADTISPEIRGVWLTTNWQLDWPVKAGTSSQIVLKQKAELCRLLDRIAEANMNVVFFQARVRGEVLYASSLEPWSSFVSGRTGVAPSYDPLAFAVEECHKRGLQCHAWMVCMPLGNLRKQTIKEHHPLLHKHPEWITRHEGAFFLEPGQPGVADYLASLASEIVSKYDVDGIHMDYIRYPDSMKGYPDEALHKKSGTALSREDWRRENITRVVYAVHDRVKQEKPWVKVSSSPLGRFRDLPGMKYYGWNAFESVYQDVERWLRDGKQDLVVPMMYYKEELFYPYLWDWIQKSNGRPIVSGLGAYRLGGDEANWPLQELQNQILATRQYGAGGQCIYRARNFTDNLKGLARLLGDGLYAEPALYPPMYWENGTTPEAPSQIRAIEKEEGLEFSWKSQGPEMSYTLYGKRGSDHKMQIVIPVLRHASFSWTQEMSRAGYDSLWISASNRYHHESKKVPIPLKSALKGDILHCFSKISYNNAINVLCLGEFSDYAYLRISRVTGESVFQTTVTGPEYPVQLLPGFYRIELITRENKIENQYLLVE